MAGYMELMGELFERSECLSENATHDEIFAFLSDNRSLIKDISNDARGTGLFEKSKDQYLEFKTNILKDESSPEKNVVDAYMWVLDRIINAPTQIHMKSAVLLCMPIVDDAFLSVENTMEACRD